MSGVRVVCIAGAGVPTTSFNLGHRLGLHNVAAHVRGLDWVNEVRVLDAGALNHTWKEVQAFLRRANPDIVAIYNDFGMGDELPPLLHACEELTPHAKRITFGRLSQYAPDVYRDLAFDAIAWTGDPELSVGAFVESVAGGSFGERLPGVLVRTEGTWEPPSAPGARFATANQFPVLDHSTIPYHDYWRIQARHKGDEFRYCALPGWRQVFLEISRGCPVGCGFCDVGPREGRRERRMTVAEAADRMVRLKAETDCDYVSLYSETATLHRKWMLDFCDALSSREWDLPWTCTTTLFHLDQHLIRRMAAAGCIRISVGLEVLGTSELIPHQKEMDEPRLREVARWCADARVGPRIKVHPPRPFVQLNCLCMVGLDVPLALQAYTKVIVESLPGDPRYRPTAYTDLAQLHSISASEVGRYNKTLFPPGQQPPINAEQLYDLIYPPETHESELAQSTPRS